MPDVIKTIKEALDHNTPSQVPWRARLETALFEIERQRQQIEDAELALNVWDAGHDSEYWLRHPRDPGDFVAGALGESVK